MIPSLEKKQWEGEGREIGQGGARAGIHSERRIKQDMMKTTSVKLNFPTIIEPPTGVNSIL